MRLLGVAVLMSLASAPAWGATQVLAPSDDTFINSGNPANNNGASSSVFTGTDGHGGLMRGLVRFAMPAGLQGRVTVSDVQLRLTVRDFPNGTAGTPAVETLAPLTQAWVQGNGSGEVSSTFTVGMLCGGTVTGATWNQTNCTAGTSWTTPGGTVGATPSGQADTTGIAVGSAVVWDSASNPRMLADAQSWIDTPASNDGWQITSSTEGAPGEAQRFFSTEAGVSAPSLTVTYACKPGFVANGNACVAAGPSAPAAPPWALALLAVALVATVNLSVARTAHPSGTARRGRYGTW
jgi:hypothetical protein